MEMKPAEPCTDVGAEDDKKEIENHVIFAVIVLPIVCFIGFVLLFYSLFRIFTWLA